jgi:SPP1 family phage portal protein
MNRKQSQCYPDYTAELRELKENGFSLEVLYKILRKHKGNAEYNRELHKRYMCLDESIPIMKRKPRFEEENPINNKISNDFFSEIVDFKTGYFAGKPFAYGYNKGEEAQETSGGEQGVDIACKAVTDFTTRNTMYGVDMKVTKFAGISGYAGRLFYIDPDGNERVMALHSYETIILSETSICEPEYAVRYYCTVNLNGGKEWTVVFYDDTHATTFTGTLSDLEEKEKTAHMFDGCPLQGIPNNEEMLGDAECVLNLIDDYDKIVSDNSNEIESFVHAYMVRENLTMTAEEEAKVQKSGSISFNSVGTREGKVYFLTKNINDAYTEHHLERLEKNIRHFAATPDLSDESFGNASGVSLKFKLHPTEAKCGIFQAYMMTAAQYMWKLLASVWAKRKIAVDPLQITIDFKRNFPLDTLTEAQAVSALISAGIPKEVAFSQLTFVDDVSYVMQLIEEEQNSIPSLDDVGMEDDETEEEESESGEPKKKKPDTQ